MSGTSLGSGHAEAESAAEILRTTVAVRERAGQLLARARNGDSPWFTVDDGKIDGAAAAIVEATRKRYPKLHIPLHSRWRHFEAGGVDRKKELERMLADLPVPSRGHAMIDLAFVSVLLDAGAGPDWKYVEPATGKTFTRSEGLAVASFHAFVAGLFSSDKNRPLQADSAGLRGLVTDHLADAFQVSEANPLVGLQERAILLRRLGEAMQEQPEVFGPDGRPSGLFDTIVSPFGPTVSHTADISAHSILSLVLYSLSGIWPAGNSISHGAAGRLLAPCGGARRGPVGRLDALPQTLAVADLFADRAVRMVRRPCPRPGRPHRAARVPQRRTADRQRAAVPARRVGGAAGLATR